MVAEAFAVLGAISAIFGTVNTVKGWLASLSKFTADFKDSGNTIQDLELGFKVYGSDLEMWAKFWGLKGDVSTRYLQELWRKDDIESILVQLTSIQALCKRFQDLLLEFFPPAEKTSIANPFQWGKMLSSKSSIRHKDNLLYEDGIFSKDALSEQRVNIYLETAMKTKRGLSTKKIYIFITTKCPILRGQMIELQSKLVVLRSLALNSYNLKHPAALSPNFSAKDLDPAKSADLLRLVLESRLASRALYDSCRSLSEAIPRLNMDHSIPGPLYLELDLVRVEDMLEISKAPSRKCLNLHFHLLVPWPTKSVALPLEMFVEGPFSIKSSNGKEANVGSAILVQACHAAVERRVMSFRLPCWPETVLEFRSRAPLEEERLSPLEPDGYQPEKLLQPLQTLLYNLQLSYYDTPVENFPLSERHRLAFKIVECGLLLCGTSWFSGFRMQRLQRSKKYLGKQRRYVLETDLVNTKMQIVDDSTTVRAHIFAIGKLLVEIATGHVILRPLPADGRKELDYEMSDASNGAINGSSVTWSSAEVLSEVVRAMGDAYGGVVEFCLGRFKLGSHWRRVRNGSPEETKDAYHEILKEYYASVYQPLKRIVEGSDLTGDGPNEMEVW